VKVTITVTREGDVLTSEIDMPGELGDSEVIGEALKVSRVFTDLYFDILEMRAVRTFSKEQVCPENREGTGETPSQSAS
jgi:hypothetical protein